MAKSIMRGESIFLNRAIGITRAKRYFAHEMGKHTVPLRHYWNVKSE